MAPGVCRKRGFVVALALLAASEFLANLAPSDSLAQTCGSGSLFAAGASYAAGAQPRRVVVDDFNGDAVLDLAIACDSLEAGTISILLGNGSPGAGDGTFRPGGIFDAGGQALDLVCRDFNGDGIRDLAVANGASGIVTILTGQGTGGAGDGTFSIGSVSGASSYSEALTADDFNGDGILDLAVADHSSKRVSILLGQGVGGVGDGTFVTGIPLLLANGPTRIAAADLNRDMIADLIVTTGSLPRLGVMLGNGTGGIGSGTFAPIVYYSAGSLPSDLALRDINSDGVPDVAVTNKSGGGIAVLLGLGNGAFGATAFYASGLSLSSLEWQDADDDGIVDLLATTVTGNQLVSLKGGGANGVWNGGFAVAVSEALLGAPPVDLAVADFNGDCAGDAAAVSASGLVDPASNLALFAGRCAPAMCTRAPTSLAVTDRPRDQGGYVRLTWHRSELDALHAGIVISYQAWRRSPAAAGATAKPAGGAVQPQRMLRAPAGSALDADLALVADVPARGAASYTADVPTTSDDTPHEFFVRAVTTSPDVFFDSQTVIGHSVNDHWPQCPPISCSISAGGSGFSLSRTVTSDQYDTTFSATGNNFYSAYDLARGWVKAYCDGSPGSSITTTINDNYWLVGTPAGQDVSFNAYLELDKHTTTYCGFHCAIGVASASLQEPGVPQVTCPGSSYPCVVLTHRAYEMFPLSVSASAGIAGSVYTASGFITATLRFSGLPPGAYVLSCTGYVGDLATPVQLSLQRARVENGVAHMVWYTPDNSALRATVYRRAPNDDWASRGEIAADGSGYLAYEDRSVIQGLRYGYRLGVVVEGEERSFGEAWIDIPVAARLALEDLTPNPGAGPVRIGFSLGGAGPAQIDWFDVGGRRLHTRDVTALGAGHHELALSESNRLPPGVYVLRLSEGGSSVTKRLVVIR